MKKRSMRAAWISVVTIAVVMVVTWLPVYASTLPTNGMMIDGYATIKLTADPARLIVDQETSRSVIRWDSFNIGSDARVDFYQPNASAATLNIVDGSTASTLAGQLTATGSVFLINPHGITVTPNGRVDTGGAFVASTLSFMDSTNFGTFMSGSNRFEFGGDGAVSPGDVVNQGAITARDAVLLGGRVDNRGTVTARLGRVALGSASRATLDLAGDGFLQVLAPADVDGEEALITNSGRIEADGGLVHISAATARDARREAINMPGEVQARSVSGRDGAIVFGGGDGGSVSVAGKLDVSADHSQGGTKGGSIELAGTTVDLNFDGMEIGAGGRFALASDAIQLAERNKHWLLDATHIVEQRDEQHDESSIGDLLRSGVDVTLHANDVIQWDGDLIITAGQLRPEASGQAGHLHLLAARSIELSGLYQTYNSNWTLTANAKPAFGDASGDDWAQIDLYSADFINQNGHLKLAILGGVDSAGMRASTIELPARYSGDALTAFIDPEVDGYDEADIKIRADIGVGHDITLSGHLRTINQGEAGALTTLSGRRVTWTTETTDRLAGGLLRFVEDGVITRYGRGANWPTGPGVDAVRLILGSTTAFYRLYGDSDPDQIDLGDLVLTIAEHNKIEPGGEYLDPKSSTEIKGIPGGVIPLSELLAPGSLRVIGPGADAETSAVTGNQYHLILEPTGEFAFKPLVTEDDGNGSPVYVSGAAGAYWIDLTGDNDLKNRVPLVIEPRPLTARVKDVSYVYGSPSPFVTLEGVANDDDIRPVGEIGGTSVTFTPNGIGFGLESRANAGEYAYAVTGILGERARNYVLDVTGLTGQVHISPKALQYAVRAATHTYGSARLPSASLTGVVAGDDVSTVVGLFNDGGAVVFSPRLHVGTYEAAVTGLIGAHKGNYVLADDGNANATLVVQPKPITWQVADVTSVYGTLATVGQATFSGVLDGDDVTGEVVIALPGGEALAFNTDAGKYAMSVATLLGADMGNYVIADAGHREGTLHIQPKALSLNLEPMSFTYGDTSGGRALGTYPLPPLVGIVGDDDVTLQANHLRFIRREGSGVSGGADVASGVYSIEANKSPGSWDPLAGDAARNYVLPREEVRKLAGQTVLTVKPKALQYSVDDLTVEYGTRPSPLVTLHGIVGNDDVTVHELWARRGGGSPMDLESRLTVGEYEVIARGLKGMGAGNYVLAGAGHSLGVLRVEPKLLNIRPQLDIVYGDGLRDLRLDDTTAYGVLPGDDVMMAVGAKLADGTVTFQPGAGTYAAIVTELLDRDARNYRLPDVEDRAEGTLTVAKRPVTLTLVDHTRPYGDHPQAVPFHIDNLVPGDSRPTNFTFQVLTGPGRFAPLTERTAVGSYTIRVSGLDDPNYTVVGASHGDARVTITPKPVRYVTADRDMVYGSNVPLFGSVELFAEDILPGHQLYATEVVVADREMYPERLQASAKYPLVPRGLGGMDRDNYVLTNNGSIQGLLTVTPREMFADAVLAWNGRPLSSRLYTFGEFEQRYGLTEGPDGGFSVETTLWSVLEGDDVALSVLRPTLKRSSQGYLAVGDYEWRIGGIVGPDAHNYVLAEDVVVWGVQINPRTIHATIETDSLVYGDYIGPERIRPRIDFGADAGDLFTGADLAITNLVVSGQGFEYAVDDLWLNAVRPRAGYYSIRPADDTVSVLAGSDAANFVLQRRPGGSIIVDPRPLVMTAPFNDSWVYGTRFTERRLYGEVVGLEGSRGVLEGDDVGFQYWTVGRGLDENNLNAPLYPYEEYDVLTPAGEYGGFTFRLTGPDAGNYELLAPTHTVTILPRPVNWGLGDGLYPDPDTGRWYIPRLYRDALLPLPGPYGGILPQDGDDYVIGMRDEAGNVRPVGSLDVGFYKLGNLVLMGGRTGNYVLEIPYPDDYLRIEPRELLFSVDDVIGQYGNYLPCLDPRSCNGGMQWRDFNNIWVPGLTLGEATLDGVLPGDDVQPGPVFLIDLNGRIGSLDDMPPPGIYFQVIDTVTGADAHNYYIGETGNLPGILEMTPQWVRWETHDALLMPETGLITNHPDYGIVQGIEPTFRFADRPYDGQPSLQLYLFEELNMPLEEMVRVDPTKLFPGMFYIVVDGFGGPQGDYYMPLPYEYADGVGFLTVFSDSGLGLAFVDPIKEAPFATPPPTLAELLGEDDDADAVQAGLDPFADGFGGGLRAGEAPDESTDGSESESGSSGAPGLGDLQRDFGVEIDYEAALGADATARTYAEALAEFGVTGVKLEAKAGVEVVYEIGPGYVRTGAEARAVARAGIGPTGVTAVADTHVGVNAGGGIEGDLGGGVSGSASATVTAGARARAETGYGYRDGKFQAGHRAQAGVGMSAGTSLGLSTDGMGVDTEITVYSPGIFAKEFNMNVGYEGGVLTLGFDAGVAIGIGGVTINLTIEIDTGKVAEAFTALGCEIGLGGCPPSAYEVAEDQILRSLDINDPMERYAFLMANPEWRLIPRAMDAGDPVPANVRRAYEQNRQLLNGIEFLERDLERYIASQRAAQASFFHELENDPDRAFQTAQSIARAHQFYGGVNGALADAIERQMDSLGLRLVVRDGEVGFAGK